MTHTPKLPPPHPRGDADRADDETPTAGTNPPGFRDALPLFIGSGVLCLALMLTVAVRQWLEPWVPLATSLGIAAVLSVSIAYLYCEKSRHSAFALGFGVCAAIALPTAIWMLVPLRLAALEHLGEHLPDSAYQAALGDPSDEIRVSACASAALVASPTLNDALVEQFSAAPSFGIACLQRLEATNPAAARSLAYSFLHRWDQALEQPEGRLVCAIAPHLYSLDVDERFHPARELSFCATTIEDPRVGRCCADAITARLDAPQPYVEALGEPSSVAPRRKLPLFVSMVPYAFKSVDASRHSFPALERSLLRKKPTRDWLLELGCGSLYSSDNPTQSIGGLEAIVESQSCSLSARDGSTRDARRIGSWGQICEDLADQAYSTDQLCTSVLRDSVAKAVHTASAKLHSALDALYASTTGRAIHRGHNRLQHFAGTPDAHGESMANALDFSGTSIGNSRSRQMARQISGNYARAMRQLKEQAAAVQKKDHVDYDESAQDLLNRNPYKPQASWKEVQEHLSAAERDELNEQIQDAKKKLQR